VKLRSKINLALLVTFVIIAGIYSVILLPFEMKRHDTMIEKIMLSLVSIVEQKKEEIANEISNLQKEALRLSLNDLLEVKDIVSINTYLQDGKLLVTTEKSPPSDLSPSEQKMTMDGHFFVEETWREQPVLTYQVSIDVIGKHVGYMKIHTTLLDLKHNERFTLIIFTALLLTVLVVIYGLLNTLLMRSVLRPVYLLKNSMKHIQKSMVGEQDDFVAQYEAEKIEQTFNQISSDLTKAYDSQDEIGSLARSFKQMVSALQTAYSTIQKAEAKYRGIFENAGEGLFQVTPQGNFISANPSAARILAYDSPNDLITSIIDITDQLFVNIEDHAEFAELFRTQRRVSGLEKRFRRKDGSVFWGSVSVMRVCDENGETRYYEGSFIDITERKEKERAEKDCEAADEALFGLQADVESKKPVLPREREAPPLPVKTVPDHCATDEPDLPISLPGFDIEAGIARVVGNKRLYLDLLLKLAQNYHEVDKDIKKAIQASDLEEAAKLAHKVKGMAGNLGADALQKAAFNLETVLSEALTDEINNYVTIFSEVLDQVVTSVRDLENGLKGGKTEFSDAQDTPVDVETVRPLLKRIADLIVSDYGEAINQIDHLKHLLGHSEAKNEFGQLELYLDEFNDSEALNCLHRIAEKLNIALGG